MNIKIITSIFLGLSCFFITSAEAQVSAKPENWHQVSSRQFSFLESLQRTQGLTSDGQGNFWFSANTSMMKVKSNFVDIQAKNEDPFSAKMKSNGANHIGDIDFYDGRIYAPIEDGNSYRHPSVGVYDATTLQLIQFEELERDWQPDGMPWLAIDGINSFLITSQYSGTTKINFYDLKSLKKVKQLGLSQQLNSIQGGELHHGFLYLTANSPTAQRFAVYKVDLISGQVQFLFDVDPTLTEVEGLTFVKNDNVESLFVLGIKGRGFGRRMNLYNFTLSP